MASGVKKPWRASSSERDAMLGHVAWWGDRKSPMTILQPEVARPVNVPGLAIVCADANVRTGPPAWYAGLKTQASNQKIREKQRETSSWFCGGGPVLCGGRSLVGPIRPGG